MLSSGKKISEAAQGSPGGPGYIANSQGTIQAVKGKSKQSSRLLTWTHGYFTAICDSSADPRVHPAVSRLRVYRRPRV